MVLTLLINPKRFNQGFYANYERLIIGKKVVHIQSIGEVKTSQQLPRNKNHPIQELPLMVVTGGLV